MGVRVETAPTRQPLEAADVALQLGVHAHSGEHLEALIAAATDRAESYLGRALITRTLILTLDSFPCVIELPQPPLGAVSAIRYLDSSGVEQTLATSVYRVSAGREPARVELAYNQSWPDTLPVQEAVEVEYTAGYGTDGESVPAAIRQAIVMMCGEMLEFREGMVIGTISSPIPTSAQFLMNGYRLGRLFAAMGDA